MISRNHARTPLVLAGWVNRQQQDVIDYQQEENRVLCQNSALLK